MRRYVMLAVGVGIGLMGGSAAWAQDAAEGEKLFKRACMACHTTEEGRNKVGPHLAGVFGRAAGSVEGYAYSPALKNAGIEWTEEHLSKYLANPREAIPGNKMAFAGVKKEADLQNLIAFLKTK